MFAMFVRYCTLLALVGFISAADKCQTPTACVPITQCPSLHAIFSSRSLTNEQATLLRSHHCGFSGKTPKVCCATETATVSTSGGVSLDQASCGYTTESKIFGGERTGLDEFPWMALLQYERSNGSKYFDCGGVLISKRYVLTAAHCIKANLINVRLGEYDTASSTDCITTSLGVDCADPPIDVPVEEKITHESYDSDDTNQYNDIALLRLKKEVTFTDYIKPVCLPVGTEELSKTFLGEKLFIAGWGLTENGTTSSIKLKVTVPVKTLSDCETIYRSFNFPLDLKSGQICAGGEKGRDSCRGDSGGPLMTVRKDKNKDNQWYAAGVVSFGPMPCGMERWPGVYTKVSQYVSWINSKLKA